MIQITQASMIDGSIIDLELASHEDKIIDARGLTLLPAVIDPHVHFRTPGLEYKEDWQHAAKASLKGGCTQVFDMPNTLPPTITLALLLEKKAIIEQQLKQANLPLRYQLFFGADKYHLQEIPKVKDKVIGIKVFMGCSTGNLVIDDDESLQAIFQIAAENNMLVALHAEDETVLHAKKKAYQGEMNYAAHSEIRHIDAAVTAIEKVITLSKRFGTRAYVLHISSAQEIALIKQAKDQGLPIFAETTPHHLFFNTDMYAQLGGKAVVNPPLRDPSHQPILLDAIHQGIIDTIGSDHAPHTLEEKLQPYGQCPSGMPGIEFMLPMLLNAYHQELLNLEEIVKLSSGNAKKIFGLQDNQDWVLVDLNKRMTIEKTESKCAWTPYAGLSLQGWPIYTITQGYCFNL